MFTLESKHAPPWSCWNLQELDFLTRQCSGRAAPLPTDWQHHRTVAKHQWEVGLAWGKRAVVLGRAVQVVVHQPSSPHMAAPWCRPAGRTGCTRWILFSKLGRLPLRRPSADTVMLVRLRGTACAPAVLRPWPSPAISAARCHTQPLDGLSL
jgi:hypothetical protein